MDAHESRVYAFLTFSFFLFCSFSHGSLGYAFLTFFFLSIDLFLFFFLLFKIFFFGSNTKTHVIVYSPLNIQPSQFSATVPSQQYSSFRILGIPANFSISHICLLPHPCTRSTVGSNKTTNAKANKSQFFLLAHVFVTSVGKKNKIAIYFCWHQKLT